MEIIDLIIIACMTPFLLVGLVLFVGGIFGRESEAASMGFLLLLILYIITYLGIANNPKIITRPIVSLERGQEVGGTFILGFGGVSTSIVYYAYEDLGNNSYSLLKMDSGSGAYKLIIKEDSNKKPSFVSETRCRGGIFKFCNTYRTLIVPKNTIQKEFRG